MMDEAGGSNGILETVAMEQTDNLALRNRPTVRQCGSSAFI